MRNVAAYKVTNLRLELNLLKLGVLGEVKHYRAWTSALGNIECTSHRPRYLAGVAYLVAPLGDRLGYAHHVNLLKCVSSKHGVTHLTCDNHKRCAVHNGVTYTCNGVCCARTAGHNADSRLPFHSCIPLGSVCGTLLMACKNVAHLVHIVIKCVKNRNYAPSRIPEYGIHALIHQGLHQCL